MTITAKYEDGAFKPSWNLSLAHGISETSPTSIRFCRHTGGCAVHGGKRKAQDLNPLMLDEQKESGMPSSQTAAFWQVQVMLAP